MLQEAHKQVYRLTDPIELRFKEEQPPQPPQMPLSPRSPKAILSNLVSLVARRKDRFTFPDVPAADKPVRLKFVDKLSNECIVVGNHRQLDVLGISLIREQFTMDTRLVGRILPTFNMQYMRIERKKGMVVVAGTHYLAAYEVNLKTDSVKLWASYFSSTPILGVQILNETTSYLYHEQFVDVMNMENNQITSKEQLQYNKPEPGLEVLCIPKLTDKCSFIFFYRPSELDSEQGMFSLYKCLLSNDNSQFRVSPIVNVYKLQTHFFKVMQLLMYDRETILINLVTQVLVIKKHYPIDVGELKYRNENSRLIYLENRNLLHVCDTRAQLHTLQVKTNSISIKSFDCIKLTKPQDYNFMTAIDLDGDRFLLVYSKAENQNIRETKYSLMVAIESTVKTKLKELLAQTQNLRDIQDVAEKMGMKKKEMFLELWCQSSKRTKADLDILLETEDYKIIMAELKKALRKNSISFREIERIERHCLTMLEQKIAVEPTENNLRRYLKSHFMLRKYMVIKNIQGKRRVSSVGLNEEQYKLVLSIQDFQDIRKRNIKNYIVELMKTLAKEPHKTGVYEILILYVEGFKLVLRHIFPEFLKDIISELGENLLLLLEQYPELLPKQNNQGKYMGVWENITAAEWDKHLFFEKLQTVDNVAVLTEIMKKDWFRWGWLIKHDLMHLKRQEFEKGFLKSRESTIYYRLLDLIFNIIKEPEKRQSIVEFIQMKYTIPEHLPGRISLYWELHRFFQLPDKLPGYRMRFQELLPLKEEDIYRMVFASEKNCKRLILTEIKEIYVMTTPREYYDQGILSYFRSSFSSISDLKYLLNRINNKKIEFHEDNQSLYAVLVEAVFYKLVWHGTDHIPIKDVLVYFESIPLYEPEIEKLQLIESLNRQSSHFYDIKLNMNLREFFDRSEEVVSELANYHIKRAVPTSPSSSSRVSSPQSLIQGLSLSNILQILLKIRADLFRGSLTEIKVLEIAISHAMNFEELIPDVESLIFNNRLLEKYNIFDPQDFLERIVSERIERLFAAKPTFSYNAGFINSLLSLLPKNTPRKKAIRAHLQMGLMLEKLQLPPKAPLVISSRAMEQIIFKQKAASIRKLDVDQIYENMLAMGTREPKSSLYEILILKFLEDGEWEDAIHYTKLWNQTSNSNVFAALIALKVGEELSKDLKENLLDILIIYMWKPKELVELLEQIIHTDDSKILKQLIAQVLFENDLRPEDYYNRNPLLSPLFKKLQNPANIKSLKDYYKELRRVDTDLQRNEVYYLYYRLLLCEPERAHELHQKYYDGIDVNVLEILVRELSRNKSNMFNSLEVLLFAYKSLMALYSLNYLGTEFDSLSDLFAMGYVELKETYSQLLTQLEEEMIVIEESEKLAVMKHMEMIYLRRKEKDIVGDGLSMEVESEDENSRNDEFLRTKPFNRNATKRTIIPPMKISEQAAAQAGKPESSNLVWKNIVEQQSDTLRLTASIRRKDSKKEDLPKNLRNTMKVLDRTKITGAISNDSGQESPPSSTRRSKLGLEVKVGGDIHQHGKSDRSAVCEVVEENIGQEDAGFEKKNDEANESPTTRLKKKSSTKLSARQLYFGAREGLSRSELPVSIKQLVKNQMNHLFAQEMDVASKAQEASKETQHPVSDPVLQQPVVPESIAFKQHIENVEIPKIVFKSPEADSPSRQVAEPIEPPRVEVAPPEALQRKPEPAGRLVRRRTPKDNTASAPLQPSEAPIRPPSPPPSPPRVERVPPKATIEQAVQIVRSEKPLVGIIKSEKVIERKSQDPRRSAKKQLGFKVQGEPEPVQPQAKIAILDFIEKEELIENEIASAQRSRVASRKGSGEERLSGPSDIKLPQQLKGLSPTQLVMAAQAFASSPKKESEAPEEPTQDDQIRPRRRSPTFGRKNLSGEAPNLDSSPQKLAVPDAHMSESKNQSFNSSASRGAATGEEQGQGISYLQTSVVKEPPAEGITDELALEYQETDAAVLQATSAILQGKDYSVMQRLLTQETDELVFLKRVINEVFRKGTFKLYLDSIEKFKSVNIKFHSAIKAQTIRVLKNAHKAELNFDLKLLYTPEVLYLSNPQGADIDSQNTVIFEHLKPRIRSLLNETNIFVLAKLMSVSFNFNKAFEYRVQYYYLEKVMRGFLENSNNDKQYDGKMDLQKIQALVTRLPIGMTAQRFQKMVEPLRDINHNALVQMLELFRAVVQRKKDTSEGDKHPQDIQQLEQEMQTLMWSLQP